MASFLADLAARPAPRYTSYPTAAEFGPSVGAAAQGEALAAVAPGTPVALYVHVPYCQAICWYCGCNTGPAGKPERQARYLDTLKREAGMVAARMRGRVVSIHFGGGSPNALRAKDLAALIGFLRTTFDSVERPEIAVELDPRFFDAAYAAALAAAGVTRACLGVQTFAADVQQRIGRIQPYWRVAEVVRGLRYAGIRHLTFDLMYGLPGQGPDDVAGTIEQAVGLHPDRIAMFGYAHMPALLPRQRAIDAAALPDTAARFAQSELARVMLIERGYDAIGFDHYARPADSLSQAAARGVLRRNFQGFTDEPGGAVIGLGASAISQYDGLLVQNEKHEQNYRARIEGGMLAGCRGIARGADERMRGDAIERLLCDGRVDLAEVAGRHGRPAAAFATALPQIDGLAARALLDRDGWAIAMTEAGRPYVRLAAAAFDAWRDGSAGRFSQAV
ncbi:oxygen-independent coproporphyrinogen III oxidase [Sphingomonas sp.]|uniref:oxygen-independent coproporphyrinogen III oxidase n=1 Tax=Sphingomonas sp. TaxID=28214 RepID=UPI003B3ABF04